MTLPADLQSLLDSNSLDEAIERLNEEVRAHPAAIDTRALLTELLCVAGKLERADKMLDTIGTLDPGAMIGVALFRQLVRAAQARQQFHEEGRLPEFVVKPDALLELELQAAIAVREGDAARLSALIAEREASRRAIVGVMNGVPFDDFRDLDDVHAAHLEILTSTGKYFWIPLDLIVAIEFRKPVTRRDLLWQRAQLTIADGPDGEIFVPSIYSTADMTGAHRLGHETEFDQPADGVALGKGLRTFLVGDTSSTVLDLTRLTFTEQASRV